MSDADQLELRRLVEAYAIAMDDGDLRAFADIFAADGTLAVHGPVGDELLGVFRGPDGVAAVAELMKGLYRATLHHITTHAATVAGDRATGTTYCLAHHVLFDGSSLETLGVRYHEEFVRTEDGWRMGHRKAIRLWSQVSPTTSDHLLVDRAAAERHRDPT